MYDCRTCGAEVKGLTAARKHAKQGHKTQREAYAAGELHSLHLRPPVAERHTTIVKES